MPEIKPRIHALTIKHTKPWRCDSCMHDFPIEVESVEVAVGVPPEVLFFLCSVCSRQLGRNLLRAGSQVDKRYKSSELKEHFHG